MAGAGASSDANCQRVSESPDGVVPAVSDVRQAESGEVRCLLVEEAHDQAIVDDGRDALRFAHASMFREAAT